MKQNENILKKSRRKLKSPFDPNKIKNVLILKESEIVVNSILEKIISFVISNINTNIIEKKIVNFCFSEMKHKLDTIIGLQFIKHDKDDLIQKKFIKNKSQKKVINNDFLLETENEENEQLNKSQIIPNYELIKILNPFHSEFSIDNKIYLNILNRKNIFLENRNNNKNKINNKNLLDEQNQINNFWETIFQPKNTEIDRYASTKIKIDIGTLKKKVLINNKEIKEENENNEKSEIRKVNFSSKNIKKISKYKNNNINSPKIKKGKSNRMLIQTDLPSFDIEPEKINFYTENESIKVLRKEYELKLAMKKEREEKLKNITKQTKLKENTEEIKDTKNTNNKNAKIIKLKPIRIENLIAEFQDLKSHTKEIGRITDLNLESLSQKFKKKNSNIEINQNPNYIFNEEKTERKRKKQNNQKNKNNSSSNLIKKNKNEIIKDDVFFDKNGSKFASGSNFELIKLECGVELTENKKKKSGGKNFFDKFGKFSYELFKNALNRTVSENKNEFKDIMNNSTRKEENIIDTTIIKSKIKKNEINRKLIREKSDYDAKFGIQSTDNRYLNLKTKNLEIVMNNLDLMKNFELNIDNDNNNNISKTKYNFFKNRNIIMSFKKRKKDLNEINDFNKTVMKNDFWGEPGKLYNKENIYIKPPIHLFHNSKKYRQFPIIGLPRERLPHITNRYNMIKTDGSKNLEKIKIKNLSKDNINEKN